MTKKNRKGTVLQKILSDVDEDQSLSCKRNRFGDEVSFLELDRTTTAHRHTRASDGETHASTEPAKKVASPERIW